MVTWAALILKIGPIGRPETSVTKNVRRETVQDEGLNHIAAET